MSADTYTVIKKKGDKWVLVYGCASNDYQEEVGEYDTLELAVEANNEEYFDTEYGLRIVTTQSKEKET